MGRLGDFMKFALRGNEGQPDTTHAVHLMEVVSTIFNNQPIKDNLDLFRQRLQVMQDSEGYQDLNLEAALEPVLTFFDQSVEFPGPPLSEVEVSASNHLRLNLATLLRSNDLSQFLLMAGDQRAAGPGQPTNAVKFYQVLQTLSEAIGRENQGPGPHEPSVIQKFLKNIVKPSLSEKPYTRYSPPHDNTGRTVTH